MKSLDITTVTVNTVNEIIGNTLYSLVTPIRVERISIVFNRIYDNCSLNAYILTKKRESV